MNRTIPPEIASWSLKHAPYGFAASADWVKNLPNVEGILQLSCPEARLTLAVGCYPETLTIMLVLDQNWVEPIDQSPLGSRDHFRSWLASVAVPSALSLRYPSNDEMWLYRDYSDADIERDREVDHD